MIVALRVLLLAVAAVALAAALAIGLRGRGGDHAAVRYACPMHPEVRADAPGECTICRMALERVGKPGAASNRAAAAESADFAAVENVRRHNIVDFVRRRSLLVPARELRGPASVGPDGTVSALFYDDEIAALDEAETGLFTPTAAPQLAFRVRREPGAGERWDGSTTRSAFVSRAASTAARGRARWMSAGSSWRRERARCWPFPPRRSCNRPRARMCWPGPASGFNFEKRPIEIGETFLKQGFAVVLSGLTVNERVVGRATFFLEADRRAGDRAVDTGWSSL